MMDLKKVKLFVVFFVAVVCGTYSLTDLDDEELLSLLEECLVMTIFLGDTKNQSWLLFRIGDFHINSYQFAKAIEYYMKCLTVKYSRALEPILYSNIGIAYYSSGEYYKAIEYYEKHLTIAKEIDDKQGEGKAYGNIGDAYHALGEYHKAIEYHEKQLIIAKEIGDRHGEGYAYGSLGIANISKGEYHKAIEYHEKQLTIARENGDKQEEGNAYGSLGNAFESIGEYQKAIGYYEKSLSISKEIGDGRQEGYACRNLGIAYQLIGEYPKGIEYNEQGLSIAQTIGDRKGEENAYGNLGIAYYSIGEYHKAIEYHKKSLIIAQEICDRQGEGSAYGNLGNDYHELGEYHKQIEYHEKHLTIAKEIGNRKEEGNAYGSLGIAYHMIGEYHKAITYHDKSLSIFREIGDRRGEGNAYGDLGNIYESIGEYHKQIECHEKGLSIFKEIGDTEGEGNTYGNLGNAYLSIGEYHKSIEYHEKHLTITNETGNRKGEGSAYGNLGNAYRETGEHNKAIEYHEKHLTIAKEIGNRKGEGNAYGSLGNVYYSIGEYHKAIEYHEKALRILKEIGNRQGEASSYNNIGLAYRRTPTKDLSKAKEHYQKSIQCYEVLFEELKENDQLKISIVDTFIKTYKNLSNVYIETGQTDESLLACECGRARVLRELLGLKYIINNETTSVKKPLNLADVKTFSSRCCTCIVFYDLHCNKLTARFWIVAPQCESIFFYDEMSELDKLAAFVTSFSEEDQRYLGNQGYFQHLVEKSYDNIMVRESMQCEDRSLGVLECEDQELSSATFSGTNEVAANVFQALTRCIYDEEEEDKPLEMLYARLISPVQDHLTQDEIVIIPDGPLFMVPFAALQDPETGKFLSEAKCIRMAPSLTTLKLLQESSDDQHYKSGALIVGNPATGTVMYRGKKVPVSSLPGAEDEAKLIGGLLGVEPLIGEQATKQEVLRKLQDGVSVIHFAAHGSEKNGQIFLAPSVPSTANSIAKEEDYILTMKEAQESGIRAQLVVLSCCHSGRGDIKSEGVVGMTRAFLAAGARAVVASLWAIDDEATKLFMLKFYSHLKKGESASKSLQQAMKEMRETKKYNKPMYWAAFFLIGDDVTISV